MSKRCPDCHGSLSGDQGLYCHDCEFEHYDCGMCGKVFNDESKAADCEYSHRTVLDDIVEALD